ARQLDMMKIILHLHDACKKLLLKSISINEISEDAIFERIINMKYDSDQGIDSFGKYVDEIDAFYERKLLNKR
ncbi:MAG: V-type ATP synthase subunit A, partial [Defluviitaleaceae bacterium]|nr:V-type ATP synthase subunit A [Defluviitaleaceae bacterium]